MDSRSYNMVAILLVLLVVVADFAELSNTDNIFAIDRNMNRQHQDIFGKSTCRLNCIYFGRDILKAF